MRPTNARLMQLRRISARDTLFPSEVEELFEEIEALTVSEQEAWEEVRHQSDQRIAENRRLTKNTPLKQKRKAK